MNVFTQNQIEGNKLDEIRLHNLSNLSKLLMENICINCVVLNHEVHASVVFIVYMCL